LYKSISGKELKLISDIKKKFLNLKKDGKDDTEISSEMDNEFWNSLSQILSRIVEKFGVSNSAAMQAFAPQRRKEGKKYEYYSLNLQPWQIDIRYP
jgi:hypothetical protein